eukprot:TRINITY_DN28016_c1_g1_i2.p1 TRINITY_DN28016_c1_g1~~TRINITY_DN28016_c1_g1_i2.p1  ORF type:complete len:228 (+),score=54.50 TRINITY_DN28016_c1_g1_i2:105-788(+)
MGSQDEWYGEDIPEEGYDLEEAEADKQMAEEREASPNGNEDDKSLFEQMQAKLHQMEAEAAKLKEMQNKAEQEAGLTEETEHARSEGDEGVDRSEVDKRSLYIGNVDYSATPEELQQHFQSCGTVNRVTIMTDKFGNPKGFAYLEFLEPDAVENALLLNGSELRGREIKVNPKRTNQPGFKRTRGRGRRGGWRGRGMGFFVPYPIMYPYPGGGRGRGRGRGNWYTPY